MFQKYFFKNLFAPILLHWPFQNTELFSLSLLTLIRLSMANLPFKPNSGLIFLKKKDICRFRLIQSTYFFLKRQILYFLFFDFKFNQLRSMGTTKKNLKKQNTSFWVIKTTFTLFFLNISFSFKTSFLKVKEREKK